MNDSTKSRRAHATIPPPNPNSSPDRGNTHTEPFEHTKECPACGEDYGLHPRAVIVEQGGLYHCITDSNVGGIRGSDLAGQLQGEAINWCRKHLPSLGRGSSVHLFYWCEACCGDENADPPGQLDPRFYILESQGFEKGNTYLAVNTGMLPPSLAFDVDLWRT